VYLAPVLVGGAEAPGAVGGLGFTPIAAARTLTFDTVERFGRDVRLEGHVHRDR
jgi:diaminohydroxyphosphoribosylaminopyrimidine deaminase/5-amino-6-(5-phosphoribosylamino)uracil reductase